MDHDLPLSVQSTFSSPKLLLITVSLSLSNKTRTHLASPSARDLLPRLPLADTPTLPFSLDHSQLRMADLG